MGRTIYVVDADDARAALDQIKVEAIAHGGEDGGRIAALTGIARVFLDRADKSRYRRRKVWSGTPRKKRRASFR